MDKASLKAALASHYGVDAVRFVRMRTVIGMEAADGLRVVWKEARARDTPRRLWLLATLVDQLAADGMRAAGPIESRTGLWRVALGDGTVGYLQPWLPGKHVNLADRQERLRAVATAGHLHAVARRYTFLEQEQSTAWTSLAGGNLETKLRSKAAVVKRVWPEARQRLPVLGAAESWLFSALAAPFPVQPAPPCLCHRDFAPHNALSDGRVPLALIDLDHAGLDDPLLDLMQLVNHTVYSVDLGAGDFIDIVEATLHSDPGIGSRREFLWQLLRFPDVLVRALAEWARAGLSDDGGDRVQHALQREQQRRWQLATANRRFWSGTVGNTGTDGIAWLSHSS